MKNQTKQIALCGMMAAVGVVILLIGSVLGLGIYLAPIVAGILPVSLEKFCPRRNQVMLWVLVSALAFRVVPEVEETMMYSLFFGWYPILYPDLVKLPKGLRLLVKLLLFNVAFLVVEFLVMWVLVPQMVQTWYLVILIVLGNAMFLCYDRMIPVVIFLMKKRRKA